VCSSYLPLRVPNELYLQAINPYSEDELKEDGGSNFVKRVMALAQGLLDRLVLPACCWATWRGLRHFDDVCWSVAGQLALFLVTPFISLVGLAIVARMVASD
jgi:hypothetical protein